MRLGFSALPDHKFLVVERYRQKAICQCLDRSNIDGLSVPHRRARHVPTRISQSGSIKIHDSDFAPFDFTIAGFKAFAQER